MCVIVIVLGSWEEEQSQWTHLIGEGLCLASPVVNTWPSLSPFTSSEEDTCLVWNPVTHEKARVEKSIKRQSLR